VSDKYLWDRSGPPDPEIARLEQLLGTLRAPDAASPPRAKVVAMPPRATRTTRWFLLPLAAAATITLAAIGLTWRAAQQPIDQRRQKFDQAGVDHAKIEGTV